MLEFESTVFLMSNEPGPENTWSFETGSKEQSILIQEIL